MIGIFGGTFDPIHFGHLRPVWEVKQALALTQVRLIPCFMPPHRDMPGATARQRLEMLRLAIAGVPDMLLDSRELDRGGPSYMVDTLESLRVDLGEQTPMCLIIGADAYADLPSWHQWQRLAELAHIVVMQRPGVREVQGELADWQHGRLASAGVELTKTAAGKIWFQHVTQLDISATKVRNEIKAGRDVRFLTAAPVSAYIAQNDLYRNE